MTHQKGKAYRSKEEIAQEWADAHEDYRNDEYNVYDIILLALNEYATQEKDRQEGWTDEDMKKVMNEISAEGWCYFDDSKWFRSLFEPEPNVYSRTEYKTLAELIDKYKPSPQSTI